MDGESKDITAILGRLNGGDPGAFSRLVDVAYDDIRRISGARMAKCFQQAEGALTLQPTAIANDAVLELRRQRVKWEGSKQFFAIATRLIERLLKDYRKQRNAKKRGGGKRAVPLENNSAAVSVEADHSRDDDYSAIHRALQGLHAEHPRKAEVVTLHVICGRSLPQIANTLGIGLVTAERDWAFAKKWLQREMAASRSG